MLPGGPWLRLLPKALQHCLRDVFESSAIWIDLADQAQSLNLYMSAPNGKKMDNLYKLAWVRGLKTTYYLRSLGATHVEKSTLSGGRENKLAAVDRGYAEAEQPASCAIDNPECEACQ